MYSYGERLRAVKLYLTLGKRCKVTIQQALAFQAATYTLTDQFLQ